MPLDENYRGLLGREVRPLTEQETQVLFTVMMCNEDAIQNMIQNMSQIPTFRILNLRCEMHNINVQDRLLIFVASLCRNPGNCVLWAYTLKRMQYEAKSAQVTLDDFAQGPFGFGIPTDTAIHQAWDAQKIKGRDLDAGHAVGFARDNYLDHSEAWTRLDVGK